MTQCLKVNLYQSLVNYRRENSFGYVQSYPLPTPSMVRGMIHALLDLRHYEPFDVAIQGAFDSVSTNMQRIIKLDRDPKSRPKNPYHVTVGHSEKTATHGVMFVDQLVDVRLRLYIRFQNNPELIHALHDAMYKQTITLGRHEDFCRLDNIQIIELTGDTAGEDYTLEGNTYVQLADLANPMGTILRLPYYYAPVQRFEDKRIFKRIEASFLADGATVRFNSTVDIDPSESDFHPVLWLVSPS